MTSPQQYNMRRHQRRALTLPSPIPPAYIGWMADPASDVFAAATEMFQVDEGLVADGKYGPKTERAALTRFAPAPSRPKISAWMGWGQPSRMQLQDLFDAGCTEIVFNLNNAGGRGKWQWNPSRSRTVKQIEVCKDIGFEIALMPWVWAIPTFLTRCAFELHVLTDEVGGVSRWELDAEGSWEATFKARLNRPEWQGLSRRQRADRLAAELVSQITDAQDGEELSVTLLYWQRIGGSALLKHPAVTHAVVQAYSVWLKGSTKKALSTHSKGFAPDTLQRTAVDNYDDLKFRGEIERLTIGLGWWSQTRPSVWNMTEAEAIRRASNACLSLGVDGVSAWAIHLWDDVKKQQECMYWDLALKEMAYISGVESRPFSTAAHDVLPHTSSLHLNT